MSASNDLESFDVIVVGTGPGGAAAGYALARQGRKVLFLEKGESYAANPDVLAGDYAEMFFAKGTPRPRTLKNGGRFFETILESGKEQTPMIGCSAGGSTALFGMAMERFFECDFLPRPVTDLNRASTLPKEGWPISYAEMLPYYEKAETLFGVKGVGDPLRAGERFGYTPPPPITKANQELFDFLKAQNLSPYVMPRSCDFVPGCIECQGFICPKNCKNDGFKMCVKPAVEKHGAVLRTDCDVLRLIADGDRISKVVASVGGKEVVFAADIFILAAGAIATPALLLNSRDGSRPEGLANGSGEVGRNLMRHCIDLYVIKTRNKAPAEGFSKEIAFNDLYAFAEERLGTLQSFGRLPPTRLLAGAIHAKLASIAKPLGGLFNLFRPIAEFAVAVYFDGKITLASILEDLPYRDNRVTVDPGTGKPIVRFKLYPYEVDRIRAFRKRGSEIFRGYPFKLIKQAKSNKRLAHVCGTCRMGNDPRTSVVDRNCRSHDFPNLYVADASVFPTSGGTNPALTVAANALRIAEAIKAAGK